MRKALGTPNEKRAVATSSFRGGAEGARTRNPKVLCVSVRGMSTGGAKRRGAQSAGEACGGRGPCRGCAGPISRQGCAGPSGLGVRMKGAGSLREPGRRFRSLRSRKPASRTPAQERSDEQERLARQAPPDVTKERKSTARRANGTSRGLSKSTRSLPRDDSEHHRDNRLRFWSSTSEHVPVN